MKCSELFTVEEAELAAKMPPSRIPAEAFAREIVGGGPKDVESLLETMANKGLVFTHQRGEVRFYSLMMLVPGIFEMQAMKGEVSDRDRKPARITFGSFAAFVPCFAHPWRPVGKY